MRVGGWPIIRTFVPPPSCESPAVSPEPAVYEYLSSSIRVIVNVNNKIKVIINAKLL